MAKIIIKPNELSKLIKLRKYSQDIRLGQYSNTYVFLSQGISLADGRPSFSRSTSTRTLAMWPMLVATGTTTWLTRVRSIAMSIIRLRTRTRTSARASSLHLDCTQLNKNIKIHKNNRIGCYDQIIGYDCSNFIECFGKIFRSVFQYIINHIENIRYVVSDTFLLKKSKLKSALQGGSRSVMIRTSLRAKMKYLTLDK